MKSLLMSAVLISGLTLATAASASNQAGEVFIPGKPLQQQIERIEIELNDGETYSELKQTDRSACAKRCCACVRPSSSIRTVIQCLNRYEPMSSTTSRS